MKEYRPRLIDKNLENVSKIFGAVVITGPKWCGKTTTAKRVVKNTISLQEKKVFDKCRKMADIDPGLILEGEHPLLIDEWQTIPEIWDAVRFYVDEHDGKGLFVMTGSSTIDNKNITHSGAGRITRLHMRTMSLFETGDSNGTVKLGDMFEGKFPSAVSKTELTDVAGVLVRGGWPETIGMNDADSHMVITGYCISLLDSEIVNVDGKRRDPNKMERVLRSLSRNSSTQASASTILKDVVSANAEMSLNTLYDYLDALKRICATEDLIAWSPKLRSKTAIRTSNTRHLSDPAIAAYFLGAGAKDLMNDLNTFGLLFESLVVRDLRIYADTMEGRVYHYRDADGLEVDAIIHLWGGRWGAVEVKLTDAWADEGAKNLLRLKNKIDADLMNQPSFLAVITATGTAYMRPDGVYVVPITCLRN